MNIFRKKEILKEMKETDDINQLLYRLPKWSIKAKRPMFLNDEKKRKLIQFVGVSRIKPPVMAWMFWDGIFISMGDRLYKPPHDIRGDVFFYDLDNSRPLLDNLQEDSEKHQSLRMAQVKNIAYAMGRIAGAQDLLRNLGLVLMGIGFIVLLCLASLYLAWTNSQSLDAIIAQLQAFRELADKAVVT